MASKTLTAIMKHWTAEFPPTENPIGLPFNIEAFCRENDQALREAKARGRSAGMERAAKICDEQAKYDRRYCNEGYLLKSVLQIASDHIRADDKGK